MLTTTILLLVIVVVAVFSELLVRKKIVSYDLARKLLHITAISLSAFSIYVADYQYVFWATLSATPVLFLLVRLGVFNTKEGERNSWGIFYFALAFSVLLWLFPQQKELIFFPMIVLALADGFAALTGTYFGKHWYRFGSESKSLEGSVAFFVAILFCLQFLPKWLPFAGRPFSSFFTVLIVSVFITLVEAISIKGRDNLWIPFGLLYWMILDTHFIGAKSFFFFAGLGVMTYFIFKMKWLSASGAIGASLLGWLLIISPDPVWVSPAIVFLVLGTLISKLPKKDVRPEGAGRNANQVFYNGGVYAIFLGLYFISHQMVFLVGGLASLTAAMSDTASSEIGSRFSKRTFNIANWKRSNSWSEWWCFGFWNDGRGFVCSGFCFNSFRYYGSV